MAGQVWCTYIVPCQHLSIPAYWPSVNLAQPLHIIGKHVFACRSACPRMVRTYAACVCLKTLLVMQVPVIGFIGRLDYQKGADLVLAAAPWLLNQDVQIICLGTGDKHLEVKHSQLTCPSASPRVKTCCHQYVILQLRTTSMVLH